MVVLDEERTRPVPPADGLRVLGRGLDLVDPRPAYPGVAAVERHAALGTRALAPMNVHAIENEVMRLVGRDGLAAAAEFHDVAGAGRVGHDLQKLQPPVARLRRGTERGTSAATDHLRQLRGVARRHASRRRGQRRVQRRRPNDDVARSVLRGQREIARERGTCFERDDVARLGAVQGRLKVAPGFHRNRGRVDARTREEADRQYAEPEDVLQRLAHGQSPLALGLFLNLSRWAANAVERRGWPQRFVRHPVQGEMGSDAGVLSSTDGFSGISAILEIDGVGTLAER